MRDEIITADTIQVSVLIHYSRTFDLAAIQKNPAGISAGRCQTHNTSRVLKRMCAPQKEKKKKK